MTQLLSLDDLYALTAHLPSLGLTPEVVAQMDAERVAEAKNRDDMREMYEHCKHFDKVYGKSSNSPLSRVDFSAFEAEDALKEAEEEVRNKQETEHLLESILASASRELYSRDLLLKGIRSAKVKFSIPEGLTSEVETLAKQAQDKGDDDRFSGEDFTIEKFPTNLGVNKTPFYELASLFSFDAVNQRIAYYKTLGKAMGKRIDEFSSDDIPKGLVPDRFIYRPETMSDTHSRGEAVKKAYMSALNLTSPKSISFFWCGGGGDVASVLNRSRRVERFFLISTKDYPLSEVMNENYSSILNRNRGKLVFLDYPGDLFDLQDDTDWFESTCADPKNDLFETSCFFSSYTPQAIPFSKFFQKSVISYVKRPSSFDGTISQVGFFSNDSHLVKESILTDYVLSKYSDLVQEKDSLVFSTPDPRLVVCYSQHSCFIDRVVLPSDVDLQCDHGGSVFELPLKVLSPSYEGTLMFRLSDFSSTISFPSSSDSEDVLSSEVLDNSKYLFTPCVDYVERVSLGHLVLSKVSYPSFPIHVDQKYLVSKYKGQEYLVDVQIMNKSFFQRRMIFLRHDLPVLPMTSYPKWAVSFAILPQSHVFGSYLKVRRPDPSGLFLDFLEEESDEDVLDDPGGGSEMLPLVSVLGIAITKDFQIVSSPSSILRVSFSFRDFDMRKTFSYLTHFHSDDVRLQIGNFLFEVVPPDIYPVLSSRDFRDQFPPNFPYSLSRIMGRCFGLVSFST